ncbi:hypothetical protein EDB81DRAFT_873324 [Dactylonectria macrodidyma]|uniref:Heterokaryon incompatibility domain-containing protein n=1 Tax=Dactylonectria macrodidyma TaxID=307937 RepID=A0A9P9ICF1_9HYPO|nr:hypothetical protein EDB81DRAFT_873324 [Dactylonectria macrodidyma]
MPESSEVAGSPSRWASDCKACQTIWRRLTDPESSTEEINFGSFKEALSTECPTHKPLLQSFNDYVGMRERTFQKSESKDSLSMGGYYWGLLLVKKDSVPSHPGTGRVLDPNWADLDMLKAWKKKCLSSHGAKCENPTKIWPTRPAWLVDVEQKCLVPGQTPGNFVALSYTNGDHTHGLIDADTLVRLQEPRSLDAQELSEFSTPVIQHAIHLTSVIGERYLWVDALCIPRDDRGATVEQLKAMGAIYANAIVTIISADDDSTTGIAGLEAWTFQEYRMAQRRIWFSYRELHWECSCNLQHEETVTEVEVDKPDNPSLGIMLAGFPDLDSLALLLTHYNDKSLRYDEDALPAISGLLSVVSRSFTGGFLYGVPEASFERGLSWRPYWPHTNLRRRIPSIRPVEDRLAPSGLPSWSWLGWCGVTNPGFGEAGRINPRGHWIEETIPTTEWYTSRSPSDPPSQRRRIKSTWLENRDSYKDFTKPLPPGWTRHAAPMRGSFRDEPHLYPDGCDKYVFTHAAFPGTDDLSKAWYYPFPVTDIQESTPPFTPEQTQYLFCETNKARLYSKTWNEDRKMYDLPLTKKTTYVVLWVEWKDGVAYRLASGQVREAEWDKLDREKVSLILG